MMASVFLSMRSLLAALLFAPVCLAAGPTLWFEHGNLGIPGGLPSDFKNTFENPEDWCAARVAMKAMMIRVSSLSKKENGIDDSFLREHFIPVLKAAEVELVLDVTEATWGQGRGTNYPQTTNLVRRIQEAGGTVSKFCLQSVLSKPLPHNQTYADTERVKDVVAFFRYASVHFPGVPIGIIDARPTQGKPWQFLYRSLLTALAEDNYQLDHLILDIPFEFPEERRAEVSWQKARDVEQFVRELDVKFGISLTSVGGRDSYSRWHERTLLALDRYQEVGGSPDWFVQMSWFAFPDTSMSALRTFEALSQKLGLAKTPHP